MFDWNALTKDPSDPAISLKFQAFLASIQTFYEISRNDFLRSYFSGARVMDIGAGEHNPSMYNAERWEHGIIAKVAAYAVGIEINEELCEHYNQRGYHFKCVDATSDANLGEQFDLVFLGDVIEHVNDPVALLQFAKRHLSGQRGRILLTTPNPFSLSFLCTRSKKKNRPYYIANFEHTCWITPTNANELARRTGLQFTAVYFPKSAWKDVRSFKKLVKTSLEHALPALGLPELGHKEYMYEFTAA